MKKKINQKSKEYFETIDLAMEHIGDVVWMTDVDKNQMIYISPSYEKVWGRTCEELYLNPKSFVDAICEEDRSKVVAAFPKQQQGSYNEIYRIKTPEGNVKWIRDQAFPIKNESGKVYRVVGVATDISVEINQKKQLENASLKSRRLLNTISLGTIHINADGECDFNNHEWERISNFSEEKCIKLGYLKAFSFEDQQKIKANLEKAKKEKQSIEIECKIIENSEKNKIVRVQILPEVNLSGSVDGNVITFCDVTIIKANAEEIHLAKERLELALDAVSMGVSDWDIKTNEIYWDEGMYKLFGILPSKYENTIDAWYDVVHPSDAKMVESAALAAAKNVAPFDIRFRIIFKGSEVRIIRSRGKVLYRDSGEAKKMISCYWDITEQEQMQNELQKNKDFIDNIINAIGDPIFVKDQMHRWVYGNKAFGEILNLSPQEYLGKSDYEIFPKEMADVFWEKDNQVFESFETNENEELIKMPDNSIHTILTKKTPYEDKDGQIYLIAVIRDITERKKAEDQIRNLSSLIESSTDLYGICDLEGRLIYLNSIARRLLFSNQEIKERTLISSHPVLQNFFHSNLDKIKFNNNYSWEGESKILCETSKVEIPVWQKIFVIKDEQGKAKFIATLATDIRQRKEDEIRLVHSSRMASLGEMAGGIAHEINNPLMVIMGKSAIIRRKIKKENIELEKIEDDLEKIEQTAMRMAKIVKSLRSFSREADHEPMEEVLFKKILDETLEMCSQRFLNHGVNIQFECAEDLKISCRPIQIGQVILNLLNNAFDAIEGIEDPWIKLKVEEKPVGIMISVIDNGKGVPLEHRDKIMTPFFTTKEVGKGTGLGLSISKGIIENHGGKLYLDTSTPYTKFVVLIPRLKSNF